MTGTPKSNAAASPVGTAADLAAARRTLRLGAEGLNALATSLDGAFSQAIGILAAVGGRVVVSGMGKSGHIGRKIAATLASTGTPAVFVHPAEASHGDLGMITAEDAVICLSYRGETQELTDLVAYTRRFAIPLIAIVGNTTSALAQAADIALLLPATPEACPLGLAPTTSTTLMLALGDALAVALMEHKGFSADQYQVLHPGGSLGRKLIKVSDIMHTGAAMPLVPLGTGMADALLRMTASSFGCVGVVEAGGKLVGMVTDGDLRRHMSGDLLTHSVDDVMNKRPKSIRPQALAAEAVGLMQTRKITMLFVTEDSVPIGFLNMHDCLRAGVV